MLKKWFNDCTRMIKSWQRTYSKRQIKCPVQRGRNKNKMCGIVQLHKKLSPWSSQEQSLKYLDLCNWHKPPPGFITSFGESYLTLFLFCKHKSDFLNLSQKFDLSIFTGIPPKGSWKDISKIFSNVKELPDHLYNVNFCQFTLKHCIKQHLFALLRVSQEIRDWLGYWRWFLSWLIEITEA